ncbi:hypothetical protein EYF80_031887 [Liparis tanakae]|uniref:Uncharacterized protein n=1 Tax=Liparis tanakae TaxID=230148 RepID=A0A4Z2GWC7_9TELE|nr:hypothetical protein EYF80_031887 [Liparis tanakae]
MHTIGSHALHPPGVKWIILDEQREPERRKEEDPAVTPDAAALKGCEKRSSIVSSSEDSCAALLTPSGDLRYCIPSASRPPRGETVVFSPRVTSACTAKGDVSASEGRQQEAAAAAMLCRSLMSSWWNLGFSPSATRDAVAASPRPLQGAEPVYV